MSALSSAASAHSEVSITTFAVPKFLEGVDKMKPAYRFFDFFVTLRGTIPIDIQEMLPAGYKFSHDKFLMLRYRKGNPADTYYLDYPYSCVRETSVSYISVIKTILGEGLTDGKTTRAIREVQQHFNDVNVGARRAYFELLQMEEEEEQKKDEERKNAKLGDGATNGGSSRRTSLGELSLHSAGSGRRSSNGSWMIAGSEDAPDGPPDSIGDTWEVIGFEHADVAP